MNACAIGRRTYPFIDAIRGMAALVILAHHLITYVPHADETLAAVPGLRHAVWWYGGLAAQVFLVISGFLGGVSLARATPEPAALGRLLLLRYLRLAVPALATLLFAIGLHALVPPSWAAFPLFDDISAPGVLAHVAFLQDVLGYPSLLAGFWYLSIDWQCNALLSLLIIAQEAILRRLPRLSRTAQGAAAFALPLVVAVLSLFCWNGAIAHEPYATYFFGIMFLGTLAGLAVAGRIPPAIFWAYAAACAVAVVVQRRPHPAVALAAGVAIYLVAQWQPAAAIRADSLLGRLGRISYSLFLVHYPTIWAVTSVGRGVGGDAAAASGPWLAAAVVASCAAAVLLHRLVEVPTLALVGRLRPGRSPVAPVSATRSVVGPSSL
jgi:peptidoglycan/LPS O-acetylase OafA/YrhL